MRLSEFIEKIEDGFAAESTNDKMTWAGLGIMVLGLFLSKPLVKHFEE